jgi:RNA-binding protein
MRVREKDALEKEVKELDSKTRAGLKGRAQAIEVTLRVGKAGITETLVEELKLQLKERKLVKVRILKGDACEIAGNLATDAGVQLVEVRGKTAVFWRK